MAPRPWGTTALTLALPLLALPLRAAAFAPAPAPTPVRRAPPPFRGAATVGVPSSPLFAENPSGALELAPVEAPSPQLPHPPQQFDRDAAIHAAVLLLVAGVVLAPTVAAHWAGGVARGWDPAEVAARVPLDLWRSYSDALASHPIGTKAATSAAVYAVGDVLAQRQEQAEGDALDRTRVVQSLVAGLVGHGPLSHFWYHGLEDFCNHVAHLPRAWWDFVPRVLVDQTVWGPFWNNSYILLLGIMQRRGPRQIWGDVQRTTVPLVVSGLKLWPLAHCVTYGLVPVEYRLLWVDAVEIVWVTILSTQAAAGHGPGRDDDGASTQEADVR